MDSLTLVTSDIYRLTVPFLDIYTTVFFVRTPHGWVLIDTATYPDDMDLYIFPAMAELGITADTLTHAVITHAHRDHAGGLGRLPEVHPHITVLSRSETLRQQYPDAAFSVPQDGDSLAEVLRIVTVPGHAPDALSVYDTRTKVLLTGDCLQAYGIYGSGRWGANISRPTDHRAALEKLRTMDIATLIASHEYHPVGYEAHGAAEVRRYIDTCEEALTFIRDFIRAHPTLSDEECAARYNAETKMPTLGAHVIKGIREEAKKWEHSHG